MHAQNLCPQRKSRLRQPEIPFILPNPSTSTSTSSSFSINEASQTKGKRKKKRSTPSKNTHATNNYSNSDAHSHAKNVVLLNYLLEIISRNELFPTNLSILEKTIFVRDINEMVGGIKDDPFDPRLYQIMPLLLSNIRSFQNGVLESNSFYFYLETVVNKYFTLFKRKGF